MENKCEEQVPSQTHRQSKEKELSNKIQQLETEKKELEQLIKRIAAQVFPVPANALTTPDPR